MRKHQPRKYVWKTFRMKQIIFSVQCLSFLSCENWCRGESALCRWLVHCVIKLVLMILNGWKTNIQVMNVLSIRKLLKNCESGWFGKSLIYEGGVASIRDLHFSLEFPNVMESVICFFRKCRRIWMLGGNGKLACFPDIFFQVFMKSIENYFWNMSSPIEFIMDLSDESGIRYRFHYLRSIQFNYLSLISAQIWQDAMKIIICTVWNYRKLMHSLFYEKNRQDKE